jgi:hypothetical protein
MWPITRRATLRMSLSVAIGGFLPSWKTSAQPGISDELHARFLQWSRTATGFADLTPDTARACLELLLRSGIKPAGAVQSRAGRVWRHADREVTARSLVHRHLQARRIAGRAQLRNDFDVASRRDRPAAEHLQRRPRTLGFRALQYLTRDVWPSKAMS